MELAVTMSSWILLLRKPVVEFLPHTLPTSLVFCKCERFEGRLAVNGVT